MATKKFFDGEIYCALLFHVKLSPYFPLVDPHIEKLLRCIELEEKEQVLRYRLDEQHPLKVLKSQGLVLHPLSITRKHFGYAEYPEISFRIAFPPDTNLFRDGAAIECFFAGEEPVKGILLNLDGRSGEFRLFAPDFPDWIEDSGVGIKLAPDTRTTEIMKSVLKGLESNKRLYKLFRQLHYDGEDDNPIPQPKNGASTAKLFNQRLNDSQQQAVQAVLENERIMIIHGPPGTGKTTTLAEAIQQIIRQGDRVVVAAPGNAAVDHIAKELLQKNVRILRVGNSSKVDDAVFPYTAEGRATQSGQEKEIKTLRKRADEFRRMALKYKRNFGKAEREQRNLLLNEVKSIRVEIKKIQQYHEEKLLSDAQVILGTPIGLFDAGIGRLKFHTLFIDEAGQCIEPLAWCVFNLAHRIVLAGDHWQLPPTVISEEAARLGFNESILEVAVPRTQAIYLLNTQYRMRRSIAGFSSSYFYKDLLRTAEHLQDTGKHIHFIDTAGSGYSETRATDGVSLQNDGELEIINYVLKDRDIDLAKAALITPYAGQAAAAREKFPAQLRISTVDSFQGQEEDTVIISLVRSNDEGEIGFLKDYRRMNVAITRAREQLIIIGDSATVGGDPFYSGLLAYVERFGNYQSVWEVSM